MAQAREAWWTDPDGGVGGVAPERLVFLDECGVLTNMARLHGRSTAEGLLIDRAISQEKMGQLINASRPRVNAQLQAWKGDGVLGMRRGRLIILDYRSLKIMSREGATDN